jgi:hypothetical protein
LMAARSLFQQKTAIVTKAGVYGDSFADAFQISGIY